MTHILTPFTPIYSPQSPQVITSLGEISNKEHRIALFLSHITYQNILLPYNVLSKTRWHDISFKYGEEHTLNIKVVEA